MKITSIAPLAYTKGKLEYFQFIRGSIGADYHQEPKFYYYEDGKVLLYWSAYDFDECHGNAVKLYSISSDRGLTWTDPQIFMADYLGGVPYFVNFLRLRGTNETLLIWVRSRHDQVQEDKGNRIITKGSDYFQSQSRVFIRRSNDGGYTFDLDQELSYKLISGGKELPGVGWYGSIDDILQLQSGRIIIAFMFLDAELSDLSSKKQHYTIVCLLSDDAGKTWRRSSEITVTSPRGAMECQIVETQPDRLLCLFRTKAGCVFKAVSEDGGLTWGGSEPTSLMSPESMVRMIKLKSGNLLVVWNNVSSKTQQPRHPLSAVLSKDGGHTWGRPKVIADETSSNQLSNHGMIQLDDGRILLGISHYRDIKPMTSDLDMAIFDEAWLME